MRNIEQSIRHDNQLCSSRYLASIIYDGCILKRIEADNQNHVLSKAIVALEDEFPNGLCEIKDLRSNRVLAKIKPRYSYD